MKLFILDRQCNKIISSTCEIFNEMSVDLQQLNGRKCIPLQSNFINLPKPRISKETRV